MSRVGVAPPVLFVGLDVDAVSGADGLDWSAAALDEADAFGDEKALPEWVAVPSSPRAGHEVDDVGHDTRGCGGDGDNVDVDVAGEPLGRPLAGAWFGGAAGYLHGVSLFQVRRRAAAVRGDAKQGQVVGVFVLDWVAVQEASRSRAWAVGEAGSAAYRVRVSPGSEIMSTLS